MLTITQIDYIRKLYFDKGLSITEIEKCTAHARNTITKYINQHKIVYFFTVHELINKLVQAKENRTYERFMKKLKKADLLVLDEWGYLPLHQEGARLLFEVISMCYEQKSIIITTNIEFSHWKNFLFDEKLTAAIIDRVIHHSHLLLFDGPSHRKQNALLR